MEKSLDDFSSWKKRGSETTVHRATCKKCMAAAAMQKYYANHERSKENMRKKYWGNLDWFRDHYKSNCAETNERHRRNRRTVKGRAQSIFNGAMSRARNAGFPCTIDRKFVEDRIEQGVCPRTGIEFDLSDPRYKGRRNPFSPSIDKIDSLGGYTPENTQIVVWCYNTGKGEMSDDDFLGFCKRVVTHNA